ncbi:MAG: ACR3 family arsenite efflux transporter [Candidatus Izemoplasmatales bacterium]|nr:ACR3 family arsenite efflux transporter [Candidatus Izemoplasmatales bacterium]
MRLKTNSGISFFEKYLTIFVLICMGIGVMIGYFIPSIPNFLNQFEIASVNIPIGILIWLMIYPMMLKIDFTSIKNVGKNPKGLYVTWIVNWLIKPFTMFGIAYLFFMIIFKSVIPSNLANDYLAGAVLLGAAPCTAMVFVWSSLTKGNPAYTLVQVATNDLIILLLFAPIVGFLLNISGISVPWLTLFLSVFLFVVIPLVAASLTRHIVVKNWGLEFYNNKFIPKFSKVTISGLLLTLVLIFSLQSEIIIINPLHILYIAIPLVIQTFMIFFIAYYAAKKLKLSHDIAAPAGMIGASNFFELAVAVAIALFPLNPGVALATIVGVLVEVPVMLTLVKIANKTTHWFKNNDKQIIEVL